MKSKLFRLLALLSMLSMLAAPVSAQPISGATAAATDVAVQQPDPDKLSLEPATAVANPGNGIVYGETKNATGLATYLVRLTDAPLASYRGGISGLEATNPSIRGENQLDSRSPAALAYRDYLLAEQDGLITLMESTFGRNVEAVYRYTAGNNGLAVELTPDEAAEVAKMPGVTFVRKDVERELHTDAGPSWISAPLIWNGSATGGLPGTQGEGIIVGIIDTGINPSNPSFADPGPVDGYDHTNPLGSFVGVCDPGDPTYDPTFPCNDKLIGARGYPTVNGGDPTDNDGHGSHTASTAAGNVVTATVNAPTLSITRSISGVAPHANIIAYSGCCTLSALTSSIDDAILDGVDVINYSIGSSGASDLWNDFDSVGFLNARDAGIFVAASAGNNGPGDDTVGSPADAPWIISVGASTHDRAFLNTVASMTGGATTPPADIDGRGLTVGYGPAPIVYAGDFGDPLCGPSAFPAGTWTNGEIVVCDRGTYGRVVKGQSVLDGGAGGYVLANTPDEGFGPGTLIGDSHVLPAVHIAAEDSAVLKAWLADGGSGHTATISGATLDVNPSNGNLTAGFSSRGANRAVPDIIVPDVTAPGVDIIAAEGIGDPSPAVWNVLSGTSMASPHTAGAGALLKALHPEWTPAEIQSVLMLTAQTIVFDNDGVTPANPFDMGAGRIDLSVSAESGIVMDIPIQDYWDADPSMGGSPRSLNMPSMGENQCLGTCSWTRVVSSTQAVAETWITAGSSPSFTLTVEPATFDLGPYGTQMITVTADVSGQPAGSWLFGQVDLTPTSGPAAHLPVGVIPATGVIPLLIEIETRRDAGSQLVEDLQSIAVTDLTVDSIGLTQADLITFELFEDPTNDISAGEMYDDLSQVFWMTTTVSTNSYNFIAEVTVSESPDVDLAIGYDTNGDGMPELSEEVCLSAGGSWTEYCEEFSPTAGTWWVVVMNWEESATAPDEITLATAVVPNADNGNLSVTGPTSVPGGTPYDIRVFWDDDMTAGDRWYGALTLGSDPSSPGDIGTIPVNLVRLEDDVVKTVSDLYPSVNDTLTYTITVQPNSTAVDLTYALTDTIPAGLTYVPSSAAATSGNVSVVSDTLVYTGTLPSPIGSSGTYNVTTSATDPMCDTGFGGYLDLAGSGIFAQSGITGDTIAFTSFSTGDPINYFGDDYVGMTFTDDGFGLFDFASNYGGSPWVPQAIPDAAQPNNILAAYWHDFQIFYDAGANQGVTLATVGSPGGAIIVEYDDIEPFGGGTPVMDFEIVMTRDVDNTPGAYEIVYAYDNVASTPGPATVGWEDSTGAYAGALVNNGDPTGVITDGLMVCMDYAGVSFDPVHITYQVTVDTIGSFTNHVDSITDNPGAKVESTDVTVTVPARLQVAHLAPFAMDPGTAVTITLNGTPALTNFAYTDSTVYLDLFPDTYLVEIFPGGSVTAAITGTVDLMGGVDYTAIAIGDGVNQPLSLLALVDDNTAPAAGNFKLRLGHLAPFANTLAGTMADIRLDDGTAVITDVVFGTVAPHLELPAGTYDLKITTPGGGTTLIDLAPVTLNDGDILSAFATGDGVSQPLGGYALPSGQLGFVLPLEEYNLYMPLIVRN